MQKTDVLIIGGGLSGLHTAYKLHKLGIAFKLIEARNRLGGRILSHNFNGPTYKAEQAAIDLGPSWFWPGQTRMQSLLTELNLTDKIFTQTSKGDTLYENSQGTIQRGVSGISMAGSYRIEGGIQQIIATMCKDIPNNIALQNSVATHIKQEANNLTITFLDNGKPQEFISKYIVLALPPRVANATIKFTPPFSHMRSKQLNTIATWMAGHAKLVCIYSEPFWHEQGLSGDAISHRGPLQEIHDASSQNGELYALFGFFNIPARYRKKREEELRMLAVAQLTRLFGEAASNPLEVCMKDWAFDPYTSTDLDQEILTYHPANDIINVAEDSWNQQLIWSGTESVDYRYHNNGYLEGALEASANTVSLLKTKLNMES